MSRACPDFTVHRYYLELDTLQILNLRIWVGPEEQHFQEATRWSTVGWPQFDLFLWLKVLEMAPFPPSDPLFPTPTSQDVTTLLSMSTTLTPIWGGEEVYQMVGVQQIAPSGWGSRMGSGCQENPSLWSIWNIKKNTESNISMYYQDFTHVDISASCFLKM